MKKQITGATRPQTDELEAKVAKLEKYLAEIENPHNVLVKLAPHQLAPLVPAAERAGVSVGELLLTLAFCHLNGTVPVNDADLWIGSNLWDYVHNKDAPQIGSDWSAAGFVVTGKEGPGHA